MPEGLRRAVVALLLPLAIAHAGCGARAYLVRTDEHERARLGFGVGRRPVVAAFEEQSHRAMLADVRRLPIERAEARGEYLRIRPTRPRGLVGWGSAMIALGTPLVLAAIGNWAYLAANCGGDDPLRCEGAGWLMEPLFVGFGGIHVIIGTGLLGAGAARWSPEVRDGR